MDFVVADIVVVVAVVVVLCSHIHIRTNIERDFVIVIYILYFYAVKKKEQPPRLGYTSKCECIIHF